MLCTTVGRLSGHPWCWVSRSPNTDTERRRKGRMEYWLFYPAAVGRRVSPVYLSVPRAGDVIMWSDATWWPAGDSIVRCHGTIVHSVAVTGGRRPHGWWRWTRCPCSHAGVYVLLNQLWVCDPSPRCFDPARLLVSSARPTEPNYRLSLRRPFCASHRMRRRHYSFIYWIRTVSSPRVQWTHNTIKWLI